MNRDSDKYRLLIENLPDAFAYHQLVTNDDGKPVDYIFLEANTAFEEMTGLERSEVIGKKVTQVHPKIKKSALDWIGVYGKVAQGGGAIRFEHYFEPAERWYEICAYSDEPGYFVAVFRDISKHKNMETNLHDMSGRLKAIIDNSPLLISEFNPGGQYLMGNKAVADLINLAPSEIAGCHFEDFLPPETVNLFNQRINSVVSKKEPIRVDDQITVDDISYYYMTTLFPLCDSSGSVSSIGSIAHDITDRIEVENALRESEELLARSQQIAHIGSWSLDLKTNHLTWTDEVYRIFGIEPQEFTANYEAFLNAVHPDDRMAVNEAYTSSIREERDEYMIEHRIVRRDTGEIRTVHERCVHERDDAGAIIRSFGMVQDITERKEIEEELKRQASERAAVDTFTYSVSNDLQAPLRRIEGFSEALQEECPDELSDQARDYLDRIIAQVSSMKVLTDALLQLAKVVTRVIDGETVDLSALARIHLEELQLSEPNRRVEKIVAPDLTVEGDADLTNLIIANLLDNAWKFTSGVEEAKIEFGSEEQNGRTVYYLKDNGAGFDMNHAAKLFAPFSKLHSVEDYPGIGFGLNLVYRIISRHGGEIWAEGEVDKGATFFFALP